MVSGLWSHCFFLFWQLVNANDFVATVFFGKARLSAFISALSAFSAVLSSIFSANIRSFLVLTCVFCDCLQASAKAGMLHFTKGALPRPLMKVVRRWPVWVSEQCHFLSAEKKLRACCVDFSPLAGEQAARTYGHGDIQIHSGFTCLRVSTFIRMDPSVALCSLYIAEVTNVQPANVCAFLYLFQALSYPIIPSFQGFMGDRAYSFPDTLPTAIVRRRTPLLYCAF